MISSSKSPDREFLQELLATEEVVEAASNTWGTRIAFTLRTADGTALHLYENGNQTVADDGPVFTRGYTHHDQCSLGWSRDSDYLAYIKTCNESSDVYFFDPETGVSSQITDDTTTVSQPAVSPDGRHVAFVSDEYSPRALITVDRRSGDRTVLCSGHVYYDPQWMDNDTVVAARIPPTSIPDEDMAIITASLDRYVDTLYQTSGKAFAPRPKPENSSVVFCCDCNGYTGLYEWKNGQVTRLYTPKRVDVRTPVWNRNGRLAMTVRNQTNVEVRVRTQDGDIVTVANSVGRRHFPHWYNGHVHTVISTPKRPFRLRNESTERDLVADTVSVEGRLTDPETITFESSGVTVSANVYYPPEFDKADVDSVPVITHIHGGPSIFFGYEFDYRPQFLANCGFVVIEPNYRGSSGYGRAYRYASKNAWADSELDDIVEAIDTVADKNKQVDSSNVGLVGMSHGALLGLFLLIETDRFNTGVLINGIYDLTRFPAEADDIGRWFVAGEIGTYHQHTTVYDSLNPISDIEQIEEPIIILQGRQDERTPPEQARRLVDKLKQAGIPHEYTEYPDEGHVLTDSEVILDAYERTAQFFLNELAESTN